MVEVSVPTHEIWNLWTNLSPFEYISCIKKKKKKKVKALKSYDLNMKIFYIPWNFQMILVFQQEWVTTWDRPTLTDER